MNEFAAKWNEKGEIHPLICHMIDSGAVAQGLWKHGLTSTSRQKIANWMSLSLEDAAKLIAFWTSLHDIGKATPSFQMKCAPAAERLKAAGFVFPPITSLEIQHHSLLSAWILQEFREEIGLSPQKAFINFLVSIGGHHGVFPSLGEIRKTTYKAVNLGNASWHPARLELLNAMRELFTPPDFVDLQLSETDANAFFGILSGFIVTSDWLASQTDYFPYEPNVDSLESYYSISLERAEDALNKSGWIEWEPQEKQNNFEDLFPFQPNSLQSAVIELTSVIQEPFLMILEAPTGSGKTEAALFVADAMIHKAQLRGCYVAMPTQATSNQMFGRVKEYLQKSFPEQFINLHLVHGSALIDTEFKKILVTAVADDESQRSGVNAMGWFSPRKRTLLAQFGVGTVDQTFFSVLQTRHFFLRLFGLYRKVIIFDEVHAYDVYMVEIFKRLLAWLRAIGSSVIILSATLPQNTRLELLKAYNSIVCLDSTQPDFPRVSFNENKSIHSHALGRVESRKVHIQPVDRQPDSIVALLKEKLSDGGCAAVICNTVGRAQQVYQAVVDARIFDPSEVILFHSRFPYCWKKDREEQVLQNYGKCDEPQFIARRGVVIATQVIEQSLDLDFDLMITDLAPIDLLIQRIGRLQRHTQAKYPPLRPEVLQEPACYVGMPELDQEGLAQFSNDRYIYDEYIMQRSFFTLKGLDSLLLPADTDHLIGSVYSTPPMSGLNEVQNNRLAALYKKMSQKQGAQTAAAENRMVGDVDYSNLLGGGQISLEEEDPRTHRDLQALTRDTQPTIQLVCLVENEDGSLVLLDGNTPFNPNQAPHGILLEKALRSMVSVSNYHIVNYFRNQPRFKAWGEIAQLRFAYPLIFKNGRCSINEKLCLCLHPDLGLYLE